MAEKQGKLPQALEDEPEIFDDMLPYWEAYGDLMHSRRIGMSIGPIPISEIAAYLLLFPGLRTDLLVYAVRELDSVFLEHHAPKDAKKSPAGTTPPRMKPVRKAASGNRRA